MTQLLQQFETPIVVDGSGNRYTVYLYGRSRPHDTWEGWLVFERLSDGRRFETPVETTQPNGDAILYWATGLTDTYFDGALERALRSPGEPPSIRVPPPIVGGGVDAATHAQRLATLANEVLAVFRNRRSTQLATERVLDVLPHAHADVVRAIEYLEKERRHLVRRTEQGTDWLTLTEEGLAAAGLQRVPHTHQAALIDRPKNVR